MTMPTITLKEIDLIEACLSDGTYTKQEVSDFMKLCAAARRGVNVPATEDQNARFAIEGCIEYGRQGVNPPPDHHWLAPFWNIGKQLSEIPEKDDRLLHLEEAYQSSMRVGVETKKQAERAEADRDAAVAREREACVEEVYNFRKESIENGAEQWELDLLENLAETIRDRADQRGPANSAQDGLDTRRSTDELQSGPRPTEGGKS